jgi:hypothetical protein
MSASVSLAAFRVASNELFWLDLTTMSSYLIVTAGRNPPRYSTQLAADANGALYLFGGFGDAGMVADLRRLDPLAAKKVSISSTGPAALRWSLFSGGTTPGVRMGGGFTGSGTELYLFGGASNLTIQGYTLVLQL